MIPLNIQAQLTAAPAPKASQSRSSPTAAAEAPKRASEGKKPEGSDEAPANFASALQSQINKKPADSSESRGPREASKAAKDSSASQATADDDGAITSSDLAALLPLLVTTTALPDAATADASLAEAAASNVPPPVDLQPTEVPLTQIDAQIPALVAQLTPTVVTEVKDPRAGKSKEQDKSDLFSPLISVKADAETQSTEKIAVTAAIAADPRGAKRDNEVTEAKGDDFRAFMDRAATMAQSTTGRGAASGAAALRVDTPVGQTGWREEMGQKLTWMVGNNKQQAEIILTPPQLGRIEVSLTMNGDQATAIFTAANPAVREALEESMQKLRDVLADAGVSLGQTQVGAESPNQFARNENNEGRPAFGRGTGERYGGEAIGLPVAATGRFGVSSGRGMVDVFA